jgi:hypothetical protein
MCEQSEHAIVRFGVYKRSEQKILGVASEASKKFWGVKAGASEASEKIWGWGSASEASKKIQLLGKQ